MHMERQPEREVISNEIDVFCMDVIAPHLMEFWIELVQSESGCLVWWCEATRVETSSGISFPCYVVSTMTSAEKVTAAIQKLSPVLETLLQHTQLKQMFRKIC